MKKRKVWSLSIEILSSILILMLLTTIGCQNSSAAVSKSTLASSGPTALVSTTPVVNTSSTTQINPSSITPVQTDTKAPTGVEVPLQITTHDNSVGYAGNCLLCHGPGMGVQQFPLPPAWPGSVNTPGNFEIANGVDADHTGRTIEQCFSCHTLGTPAATTIATAPLTTTTSPPTSTWTPTTVTGVFKLPPIIHTHPIAGAYADCMSCHAPGASDPYNAEHAGRTNADCRECHEPEEE